MASYVTLNVGGKQFLTMQSTLLRYPDNFFTRLFYGMVPSTRNAEGHYLIDRDGEIFRHVLNFMRCRRLVLPNGFSEYDLLECEAEFYQLGELKKLIQEQTRGGIGMRVGGKIYRMTTGEASKEQDSFFAKMLSGEISVFRDPFGNYVVGREKSLFQLVLQYLRSGGIFTGVTPEELDSLKREGEYFGLQMLVHHIESVQFKQQQIIKKSRPLYLHLFYSGKDQCIVYANRAKLTGWVWNWSISGICSKHYLFRDGMFAGVLDFARVAPDNYQGGVNIVGDILTFIGKKMGGEDQVLTLSEDWFKLMFASP